MRVLTRRDLDPLGCGAADCHCPGPLVVSGKCHTGAPVEPNYDWQTGHLTLLCAICHARVAVVQVAP